MLERAPVPGGLGGALDLAGLEHAQPGQAPDQDVDGIRLDILEAQGLEGGEVVEGEGVDVDGRGDLAQEGEFLDVVAQKKGLHAVFPVPPERDVVFQCYVFPLRQVKL